MGILRYTYNFLRGYNLDIVDDGYNNNNSGDTTFATVDTYNDLPSPTGLTDTFYVVLNSIGTEWLPGSVGGTFYSKGFYYSNGVTWSFLGDVPYQATQAQTDTGVLNTVFVTPNTLTNFSGLTTYQKVIVPKTITTNYQILATDTFINVVTASTIQTLPNAIGNAGKTITIRNGSSGAITVDTLSSQTINGSLSISMPITNSSYDIISDGTNWLII
jgi:hypothetical protein